MKRRSAAPSAWMPRDERTLELKTLEQRLTDGYVRIEESARRGADVMEWEAFWVDLLHQYERLADQLEDEGTVELAA
ncbi:MAG: hypothetical protein WBA63_05955 [Thermomicrobiales bacterium]